MTLHSQQTEVNGETPTLLYPLDTDGVYLTIYSEESIYLGNGDLTAETGYLHIKETPLSLYLAPNEALYGLSSDEETYTVYVLATMNQ